MMYGNQLLGGFAVFLPLLILLAKVLTSMSVDRVGDEEAVLYVEAWSLCAKVSWDISQFVT